MVTDRRPSRTALRKEYDESARVTEIRVPCPEELKPLFERIGSAREAEESALLRQACEDLLLGFAEFYKVPAPRLEVLGVRPHRTYEGQLSSELFGDYNLTRTRIRVWTKTAMVRKWTSSRTILSTLCHEFMHHLDVVQLGFGKSYHTTGFFERSHRLYLGVTGESHYPLAWRAPQRDGRYSIDWPETNRRRAAR